MESVSAAEAIEIVVVDHADPELLAAIVQPLANFNAAFAGAPGFRPFLLAVRAVRDRGVLGGLAGEVVYGWLSIQALYVPAPLRGLGIGARLLGRAEAEARERGLSGMVVNTFSFQARPFYERLGFAHFGTLEDCPPGYHCFYLCKHFKPQRAGAVSAGPRYQHVLPPAGIGP